MRPVLDAARLETRYQKLLPGAKLIVCMILVAFFINLLDHDKEARVTEGKPIPTIGVFFALELLLAMLGILLKSATSLLWASVANWILIIQISVTYMLEIYASEPYPVVAGIQKGLEVALFVYAARYFHRMHRIIKLVNVRTEEQALLQEQAAVQQP